MTIWPTSTTSSQPPAAHGADSASRSIVVIDLVESVRWMAHHEAATIAIWRRFVEAAQSTLLPPTGGRMIKSLGDGLLLLFDRPPNALAGIRALFEGLARSHRPGELPGRLQLRAGLHHAPVVEDALDVYGHAVNVTARLAGLAQPEDIVASPEAVDELRDGVDASVEDLGECYVKHLEEPIRAFRLHEPLPVELSGGADDSAHLPVPASAAAAQLPRPRVAVFDFNSTTRGFTLGVMLADEVSAHLAAHASLHVISRMSTRHLSSAHGDALFDRLAVNYALCGHALQTGGHVRVSLELVYVPSRQVLWGQTTLHPAASLVEDPAALAQDTARAVMAQIEVHESGRARALPLASLESYAMLLGGVRLMHRLSRRDFDRARELLEALTTRHPRHPESYAWLARWHILQVHQGWSADPAVSATRASDMARRALEHDDVNPVAMCVHGMVKTFADFRLEEAESIYTRTLDAHPNDAMTWLLKGMVHAFRGEGAQAVAHTRQARALSPLDPMAHYFDSLSASAEAAAGHYERSIELAQRSLRANALHASTLRILAIANAMLDRGDDARAAVQRLLALEPGFTVSRFLARSPSAEFEIGKTYAQALSRAGVPP